MTNVLRQLGRILLLLVGLAVVCLAMQLALGPWVEARPESPGIAWPAILDLLVLAALISVFSGLIERQRVPAVLVGGGYLAVGGATLVKFSALSMPLLAIDVYRLQDLLLLDGIERLVPLPAVLALLTWGGALAWTYRAEPRRRASWPARLAKVAGGILLVGGLLKVYEPGQVGIRELLSWRPGAAVRDYGVLLPLIVSFDLPSAMRPPPLPGAAEEATPAESCGPAAPADPAPEKTDLVVLVVEAFTYPEDLGISSGEDPLPRFRATCAEASCGRVVSPASGGGSANAEFEILSGMSLSFFEPGAVPFRDLLPVKVPGLAWELQAAGYRTRVLQAGSLEFFAYRKAYRQLGFQDLATLDGRQVERNLAWQPTDQALVEAITDALAEEAGPTFLYAFSNANHGPWPPGLHSSTGSDAQGDSVEDASPSEVYLEGLRRMDEAVEALIHALKRRPRPTVLLVLGDHWPASFWMPEIRGRFGSIESAPERYLRRHSVPILLWSNVPRPRAALDLSMNFVPHLLLETLGLPVRGFLAKGHCLWKEHGVVTRVVRDSSGSWVWAPTAPSAGRIGAYHRAQFEALGGTR
jgi:hypothetical protein